MKLFISILLLSLSNYVVAHKYDTEIPNFKHKFQIFLYYTAIHKQKIKIPCAKKAFSAYKITRTNKIKSPNFKHLFWHYKAIYNYEIKNNIFKNIVSNHKETYKNKKEKHNLKTLHLSTLLAHNKFNKTTDIFTMLNDNAYFITFNYENGKEIFNGWRNSNTEIQKKDTVIGEILRFQLCQEVKSGYPLEKILKNLSRYIDLKGEDPMSWLSRNRQKIICQRESNIRLREYTSLFKHTADHVMYDFIRSLTVPVCHPGFDFSLKETLPDGSKESLWLFLDKLNKAVKNGVNAVQSLHTSPRELSALRYNVEACLEERGQPVE